MLNSAQLPTDQLYANVILERSQITNFDHLHKALQLPIMAHCNIRKRIFLIILRSIRLPWSVPPNHPIVIIFFRGCVSEMFVTSYSVYLLYIHSWKNGNLFSLLMWSL